MLLGEYDAQGTWVKEYAYLGPKMVAMVEMRGSFNPRIIMAISCLMRLATLSGRFDPAPAIARGP